MKLKPETFLKQVKRSKTAKISREKREIIVDREVKVKQKNVPNWNPMKAEKRIAFRGLLC